MTAADAMSVLEGIRVELVARTRAAGRLGEDVTQLEARLRAIALAMDVLMRAHETAADDERGVP